MWGGQPAAPRLLLRPYLSRAPLPIIFAQRRRYGLAQRRRRRSQVNHGRGVALARSRENHIINHVHVFGVEADSVGALVSRRRRRVRVVFRRRPRCSDGFVVVQGVGVQVDI